MYSAGHLDVRFFASVDRTICLWIVIIHANLGKYAIRFTRAP